MKFRPLQDRVVIRRLDGEEKTTGGIIIPDTAQEKPMEGEVVATGPGARDEQGQIVALEVKAGDRILFGKWSDTSRRRMQLAVSGIRELLKDVHCMKYDRPKPADMGILSPFARFFQQGISL